MFVYKGKVGYCATTGISTFEDITFTDNDFNFVIHVPISDELTLSSTSEPEVVRSNIEKYLGNGVDALYNTPSLLTYDYPQATSGFMLLKLYFPSIDLSCPNAFTYSKVARGWVIYLPSLKRLLVHCYRSGVPLIDVYRVEDTQVFRMTSVNTGSSINFGNSDHTSLATYWIANFLVLQSKEFSDLENGDNCNSIIVRSYSNGVMYYEVPTNTTQISRIRSVVSTIFKNNLVPPDRVIGNDPFEPGGTSGPNDTPPGTFDKTSDPIPDSPIPTLSMADTGFTRIYNPTLSQVQNLAEYMWKTENIFETLWNKVKQSFENPMDVMIAFNIVPVAVPDGGTVDFSIMYISTGVELTRAANQFVDVDCGTLELKGYYGSALDYSPNTRIQCFLPFIGMIELNPDEVMNTTLQIKYRVDIVSGGCVAKIFIDGNCLYQYSGHCSVSVPFTASDFSSYMNAMLQVSALAVGAIAAGTGAALGEASIFAAQSIEQTTSTTTRHTENVKTKRNPETGRQIRSGTSVTDGEVTKTVETSKASFDGISPQNIANTASAVMASKAGISHAGSFNGNTGYLGVRYPFLIITTPRQCLPSSYQTLNGYPSMITLPLSDCKGYTQVQQVQLSGMTATNPEQAEILQLLKGGVIL